MTNEDGKNPSRSALRKLAKDSKQVLQEPILKVLLDGSVLTQPQLETLIIDLLVEDNYGEHVSYDEKAKLRSRKSQESRRPRGVSRGAFNRTLKQARRNLTKCLYTMLMLAYLGLFELSIFRPFEEIASKIGSYRDVRTVLGTKEEISQEDIESYRAVEKTVLDALEEISSSLVLKSELSKKRE